MLTLRRCLLGLAGLLWVSFPRAAEAIVCPVTSGCALTGSSAPAGQSDCVPDGAVRHFTWDIPQGTACASLSSSDNASETQVRMVDDFVLRMPAGSGVAGLLAGVFVDGSVLARPGGAGSIRAAIFYQGVEVAPWQADVTSGQQRPVSGNSSGGQLLVPINEPFRLELRVTATGFRVTNELCAHLLLSMPPQATVLESCNGYRLHPPLPVHTRSWGRIKTIYR